MASMIGIVEIKNASPAPPLWHVCRATPSHFCFFTAFSIALHVLVYAIRCARQRHAVAPAERGGDLTAYSRARRDTPFRQNPRGLMPSLRRAHHKQKPLHSRERGFRIITRRRPTLPVSCPTSTIGAGGLNCRVRDGNGCFPSAKCHLES